MGLMGDGFCGPRPIETGVGTQTHREESHVGMEADDGVVLPQAQRRQDPEGQEGSIPGASERVWPR